jgi:Tol biopolymer transport system component
MSTLTALFRLWRVETTPKPNKKKGRNMKRLIEFKHKIILSLLIASALVVLAQPAAHAQNFGPWGPAVSVDPDRANGINTAFNDGCPIEGPDGLTLFFASNRAGVLDVWVASRPNENAPWASPERLPFPVNTTTSNEFCPTPLPGNRLLFVSTRSNLCGGAAPNPDIYSTQLHPVRGWLPPEHLGCEVNSGFEEFSPSQVEAKGMTILFFSSSRSTAPLHKIYMSLKQADGTWGTATLVNELNAAGASDARPNVRKDGLEIVFDSTRGGGPSQIYTAKRSSIFEPWSTPELLDANVNSPAFAQSRATISRDSTRLYFGSTRANQPGDQGSDIFVSTRSR